MFNKNGTKRAFLMSVLSLILCVSMFVGTTFAWFTDEVVSSNNIIKSGNLDAEMWWSDDYASWNDAAAGAIFNYQYWEPGYTEVKYVKIVNAGNLAFQFQLNIIPDNLPVAGEVNLADVIEVRLVPAADAAGKTREELLAVPAVGTLSDLIADRDGAAYGVLLPAAGVGSNDYNVAVDTPRGELEYCIVLHMQKSAGNEYQNLSVGDGFSVQLLATQYTWENDSFDHIYDDNAMFPPKANVKQMGSMVVDTSTHGELYANQTFKFLPTQTYAEAQQSSYRYYHADFVVSADAEIPANAVALPGYYTAYCDSYNGGKWIALSSDQPIAAGTEIRLIEVLSEAMNATVFVNYEEICKWSDAEGFKCGVVDLSKGALEGVTLTVELRLYETTKDPDATSGTANEETGKYVTIGTYKYTFGDAEETVAVVDTLDGIQAAIDSGIKVIDANGANLGDFNYDVVFADGVTLKNAKIPYMYGGGATGTVTFENCEFVTDSSYSCHFDNGGGNLIFNNCTFDGWNSFGTAITGVEMNNCTFKMSYNYGILRFYQDAVLNDCVFESSFEGVDTNLTGTTVSFNNCTGIEGKIFNNGSMVGNWFVDGVDVSATVTSW